MVKNKQQKLVDLAILLALIILIYYLRIQAEGTLFGPAEGVMSFLGIGN